MRGTALWVERVIGVTALTAAVALVVPPSAWAQATQTRTSTTTKTIASGVVYRQIHDPAGPWIVHELVIDPATSVTLDTVTSAPQMGTWVRTSTMAENDGAIAAVDGDFSIWPGRPSHPFADDGVLKQSGLRSGVSFGIRRDETKAFIEHEAVHTWARDLQLKKGIGISSWNTDTAGVNQVVGYSQYGGGAEKPPGNSCGVRLKLAGPFHWGKNQLGVYRDYRVGARRCQSSGMTFKSANVVLASRQTGAGATWIKSLAKRQTVRLTWDIGMYGVMDVIGGNPMLVDNGAVTVSATCKTWFCQKNPRTGIGITAKGKILMVVVDGRKSTSVGMTLYQFAKYMQSLGAVEAMNLDGGGSATMWIKGMGVVNDPSDSSGERPVTNALVVLPGADAAEPAPLKFGRTSRLAQRYLGVSFEAPAGADPRTSMDLALADPASTGGMMDWLVTRAGLRARSALPASVLRMARQFRAMRG